MANDTYKPLVTLTTLFEAFSYVCLTVQWPCHSTRKFRIATVMI